MTILRNNYEGGTAGGAIGTASPGGDAFNAADSTVVYTDAWKAHGNLAATFNGTGSALGGDRWALDGSPQGKLVRYFRTSAAQTADCDLLRLSAGSDATACSARINGANRLRLALPGSVFPWTATADWPLNTTVRVELTADSAAGTARLAAYAGDSTSPISGMDSGNLTGLNVGGGAGYVNGRGGKLSSNTLQGTLSWDDAAAYTGSDAVSTPSPWTAPAAPTVNAGADVSTPSGNSVALAGNAIAGKGATIKSYAWSIVSQPSGSSPTLSSPSTRTTNFISSAAGRYTLRLTVADNYDTTSTDDLFVDVTASASPNPPTINVVSDETSFKRVDVRGSTPGAGGSLVASISPSTDVVTPVAGLFFIPRKTDPITYTATVTESGTGLTSSSTVLVSPAAAPNPVFIKTKQPDNTWA